MAYCGFELKLILHQNREPNFFLSTIKHSNSANYNVKDIIHYAFQREAFMIILEFLNECDE